MVREYKKKNFFEGSKLNNQALLGIVGSFIIGHPAKQVAEHYDVSRQTVQSIYTALLERCELIIKHQHITTMKNNVAEFMDQFGDLSVISQLLTLLKENMSELLGRFGPDITFEDYQTYAKTGSIDLDEERNAQETEFSRFYRYRMFKLLKSRADSVFGFKKANYAKHYAYVKLNFLVFAFLMHLAKSEGQDLAKLNEKETLAKVHLLLSFIFFYTLLEVPVSKK